VANRRQKRQFLEFPWQLYRGDAHWIPPLRMDEKELAGFSFHPFYLRSRIQTFLAQRDGEVVGRIAAIVNQAHIDYCHEKRGFFGFFECQNDREAAAALLAAAQNWLSEQGMESVRGPASPSVNHMLGTLVEGFDSPPTFLMPYNPPYYDQLIQGCGFAKAQDLYAYWGDMSMLPYSQGKHWPVADQIIERLGVRIRPLSRSRFRQDIREFLAVYNRSMEGHWSFSPMSEEELDYLAKMLRYMLIPELVVGAEIDGRLAGIVMALPDYNPRIKRIDGRLLPLGFLRLLWNRRKIKRVRFMAVNVLPEYRLMGLSLVLMRAMAPAMISAGMCEAEFSWVAESNTSSRGALEKGGTKLVKTYRVYDRDLPGVTRTTTSPSP